MLQEPVSPGSREGDARFELAYRNRRRSLGIYYTPSRAAELLASWAIRSEGDMVLEPSFGGCSLLSAALDRLVSLRAGRAVEQLFGFDVDPAAFAHLAKLLGPRTSISSFVQKDFLAASSGRLRVDAVVANPPFVSYHRMSREQRAAVERWRKENPVAFPLTASLWAYFLVHSMTFLRKGGRMAFVLPSAAVRSDYAIEVLKGVERKFADVRIFQVAEQLFVQEGAQERAVVLLADGYEIEPASTTQIRAVQTLEGLGAGIAETTQASRPGEDNALTRILSRLKRNGDVSSMGDSLTVTIGEVVGDTRFFVRPMQEWRDLSIPKSYLRPLLNRSQQLAGRLRLLNSDIDAFALPYLLLPGSEVRSRKLKDYLATYSAISRDANVTFAKRSLWHSCSYDNTADAFFPSMSHESPRVIVNAAGVSCANGFYKLKAHRGQIWRASIATASLTSIFRWSAEVESRHMGAGAMKLEPSDVRRVLLPASAHELSGAASAGLVRELDKLLRAGRQQEAADYADRKLLLDTKLLSSTELLVIRKAIQESQLRRMNPKPRVRHDVL